MCILLWWGKGINRRKHLRKVCVFLLNVLCIFKMYLVYFKASLSSKRLWWNNYHSRSYFLQRSRTFNTNLNSLSKYTKLQITWFPQFWAVLRHLITHLLQRWNMVHLLFPLRMCQLFQDGFRKLTSLRDQALLSTRILLLVEGSFKEMHKVVNFVLKKQKQSGFSAEILSISIWGSINLA